MRFLWLIRPGAEGRDGPCVHPASGGRIAGLLAEMWGAGHDVPRCGGWRRLLFGGGFGDLGAVLGAGFFAAVDAEAVEGAADDMVAHAGEVSDSSAADEDDGVLLEVVAFAADVGGDFLAVGEADSADLSEGRVGLLGCDGSDLEADAAALWAGVEVLGLFECDLGTTGAANELVDGGHGRVAEPGEGGNVQWPPVGGEGGSVAEGVRDARRGGGVRSASHPRGGGLKRGVSDEVERFTRNNRLILSDYLLTMWRVMEYFQ